MALSGRSGGDEDAFLTRNVTRKPKLVTEVAVLRNGCHFVDDDATHAHSPAARVCKEPGNDRMRA